MKIIFNSFIRDWYWQIYDELNRNYDVIVPENYLDETNANMNVNLDALENCAKENMDAEFIFDFRGTISDLIEWEKRNINIPLVIFDTNVLFRLYKAKRTIFAFMWYVEFYAKPFLESFNRDNLFFQAMAANQYIYKKQDIGKKYDVTFFGQHYGERAYWIKTLIKFCSEKNLKGYFPKGHGTKVPWTFENINKFYNQSKINVVFAPDDKIGRRIVLRTFEVCQSGNFQLLQYTPAVKQYFEINKEIVCWRDKEELFKKILYFLENEEEREKIAENGYKRAKNYHTWSMRIEEIRRFLDNKKNSDLSKFIVKFKEHNYKGNTLEDNIINIKHFLKKQGYKMHRNIITLNRYEIKVRDKSSEYYIPKNPEKLLFLKIYGKIMMIINVLPPISKIKITDYLDLKKAVFLNDNFDLSHAQYGIITNGEDWIIKDFNNWQWLKQIPSKRVLKSRLNFKNHLLRYVIDQVENGKLFHFLKISIPSQRIRRKIDFYYHKIFRITLFRYS